jgi:hypothetical protein
MYGVYYVNSEGRDYLVGYFLDIEKAFEAVEPFVSGMGWEKLGAHFWFKYDWETIYIQPVTVY